MEIKNKQELDNLLAANSFVMVDFFAIWCGPCKLLAPVVTKIIKDQPQIAIAKVDIEIAVESAEEYHISSVPTIVFFVNGVESERHLGFIDEKKLLDKISKYATIV